MKKRKKVIPLLVGVPRLFAGGVGGGGMPWEQPLGLIATSLTGPVAASVGLIGVMLACATLMFHQDLSHFGKMMTFVGLGGAVMLLSARFLAAAFGVAAAVV